MEEETLVGTLETITFQNPETGFLVGRFVPEKEKTQVTVKGLLFNVHEGQSLKLWGNWEEHPQYGMQFAVSAHLHVEPTTTEGIERYLASGVIKGIGPGLARRIVKCFGADTLDVIDETPEKLLEVPKFPRKTLESVKEAWAEHRAMREIMVFLHGHGISQGYADKIFRTYGPASVEVIKENPYRLAMEVRGIGFRTADAIAQRLGHPADSPHRAEAALVYLLDELSQQGHTGYPREALIDRTAEMLDVARTLVEGAFDALVGAGMLRVVKPEDDDTGEPYAFRPRLDKAERAVAKHLARITDAQAFTTFKDPAARIAEMEREWGLELAPEQREAVEAALRNKVLILTGGPGTGKTTIIRFILELVRGTVPEVSLAAPTGKAAKRLAETTGYNASTIHRLLEAGPYGFGRTADNPVDVELLIVDECSMIDTLLMEALLAAAPDHARLVLVGDVDQLPSVGPGMVLGDLIASGTVPVVRLEKIFRQSERSRITFNAHRIRKGQAPDLARPPGEELADFYFMHEADPQRIVEKIRTMVCERIPQRFGFDPRHEVQVITPMHKGLTGAQNLNRVLQDALNANGDPVEGGGNEQRFRVGDRVMQTKNDYEKEVFNGDVGEIIGQQPAAGKIVIAFDERDVVYERKELDSIMLAYAITVHKAQGSEYPAVVLPLTTQHAIMLQRNLLYTAITRGRKLAVVIGTEKALWMAVNNARRDERYTRLRQRLLHPEPDAPLERTG